MGVDTVGVYVRRVCLQMRVCCMFVFAGEIYVLCGFITLIGRFRLAESEARGGGRRQWGKIARQTGLPHLRSSLSAHTHTHSHWVYSILYSATDHNARHFLKEQALAPRITTKIFSSIPSDVLIFPTLLFSSMHDSWTIA